jgi:hypothetical protein
VRTAGYRFVAGQQPQRTSTAQQIVEVCVQTVHAAAHHEGDGDVDAARGRQVLFEVRQQWVGGASR